MNRMHSSPPTGTIMKPSTIKLVITTQTPTLALGLRFGDQSRQCGPTPSQLVVGGGWECVVRGALALGVELR